MSKLTCVIMISDENEYTYCVSSPLYHLNQVRGVVRTNGIVKYEKKNVTIAFNEEKLLICSLRRNFLVFSEYKTLTFKRLLGSHDAPVTSIKLFDHDYLISTSLEDKTLRLWDLENEYCCNILDTFGVKNFFPLDSGTYATIPVVVGSGKDALTLQSLVTLSNIMLIIGFFPPTMFSCNARVRRIC